MALARALVREPQLMLLDEPFGALDALTRTRMHALLQDLCARHRPAVLLVTHDVDEAILLADRVLVLTDGRITLDLPVRLDRPRDRGHPGFIALRTRLLDELGAAAELCRDWELGRFVLGSRSGCRGATATYGLFALVLGLLASIYLGAVTTVISAASRTSTSASASRRNPRLRNQDPDLHQIPPAAPRPGIMAASAARLVTADHAVLTAGGALPSP